MKLIARILLIILMLVPVNALAANVKKFNDGIEFYIIKNPGGEKLKPVYFHRADRRKFQRGTYEESHIFFRALLVKALEERGEDAAGVAKIKTVLSQKLHLLMRSQAIRIEGHVDVSNPGCCSYEIRYRITLR